MWDLSRSALTCWGTSPSISNTERFLLLPHVVAAVVLLTQHTVWVEMVVLASLVDT